MTKRSFWNKVLNLSGKVRSHLFFALIKRGFAKAEPGSLMEYPWRITGEHRVNLGKNTIVHRNSFWIVAKLHGAADEGKIAVGEGTYIGHSSHIVSAQEVTIGNYVLIADRVFISDCSHGDANHLSQRPLERPLVSKGPVVIQDSVWIGEGACVLPGVIIGKHAVIGANSVVTQSIPPFAIAAGNPARVLRSRS